MTVNLDKIVESSADYELVVVAGEDGTGEYALRNKLYGVEEVRSPLLPQGLEYLEQLQAALDARRDIAEDIAVDASDTLRSVDNVRDLH